MAELLQRLRKQLRTVVHPQHRRRTASSGGSNVYPREVEEVLLEHPDASEACVVGAPDADWAEAVVAFIVDTAAEPDLDALLLDRIARFKRPKGYLFIDDLPKNSYGKVLKRELRDGSRGKNGSMKIEGSVAVVTGAGSGIGRALARAFAAAGASVVAGDLDAAGADQTAELIRSAGGVGVGVVADASTTDGIATLISLARKDFGCVDVYVANAGIMGAPGLGNDEAEWDRIIDVNLRAHIRAAKALVPDWLQRGDGHFVAVASAAGLLTQIGAAGYSVTKHAAVGFAEWLAITYGDNGVGVSCVCPMGVDTPLLNRLLDSPDPAVRIGGTAVTSAGAVIGPDQVAELTVEAVRDGRFLVLPHPAVLDMYRQKGSDYERWIAGMRRYQRGLDQSHRH